MDLFSKAHIYEPMKSYIYEPIIGLISLMFLYKNPNNFSEEENKKILGKYGKYA